MLEERAMRRLRKEVLEFVGQDNVTLRRKLHERLSPSETRRVVMLGTRQAQEDLILFSIQMDYMKKAMDGLMDALNNVRGALVLPIALEQPIIQQDTDP